MRSIWRRGAHSKKPLIRMGAVGLALAGAVGGTFLAVGGVPAGNASAYPYADVTLTGHGWGNAYGMGQWGAFGYAVSGTDYQDIIGHFYGTLADGQHTTLNTLSSTQDSQSIRVDMMEDDGAAYSVITSRSPFKVDGHSFAANSAAKLVPTSGSSHTWSLYSSTGGSGCTATFGSPATASNVVDPEAEPTVAPPWPSTTNLSQDVLELCIDGQPRGMRGTIEGTYNSDNESRIVNTLPLEQYVADVTPSESPTYWATFGAAGPQGERWGFQELEAQAIAVRSYAMSTLGEFGFADTCDLDCQTYPGITNENATATAAVTDTLRQVVVMPNDTVAVTQYSSSDGGWTLPGTFAAEPDVGDSVCIGSGACNPHHTWTATIPVSAIEAKFPQIGTLEQVEVTQRNGVGDFGGRVLSMSIVGSASSVDLSGSDFATDFFSYGVQSYWFDITSGPTGGIGGYWMGAADGGIFSFGNATFYGSMGGKHLNEPVVGMAATSDDRGYWEVASDGGIFTFGDAGFYGSMGGKHLNEPVVGMAAVPGGGGYWEVASDGGIFTFGDARFYGSTGGKKLNAPVVGMAATPDGGGYWLVASDGGVFTFGNAAFYGSMGGKKLNEPIVGIARNSNGTGYWEVARDGGIFTFGSAPYVGSLPGIGVSEDTVVGLLPTSDNEGYLIICGDGMAYDIGDAPDLGDVRTVVSNYTGKVVGGASTPA